MKAIFEEPGELCPHPIRVLRIEGARVTVEQGCERWICRPMPLDQCGPAPMFRWGQWWELEEID